ncbi:MAG: dipeptidase [Chloroflexota bacterium]
MSYPELHRDALVIDLHNDTIAAHMARGRFSLERGQDGAEQRHPGLSAYLHVYEKPMPGADPIQIDFPLMRQASIDAAFFAIDVTPAVKSWLTFALDVFGYLFDDIEQSQADVAIVRRADDILAAKAKCQPAVVLAVENADCTEGSLNVLRALYELGVRSIGLTHNISSCAADGCQEARPGVGLTPFGVQLVHEMNRLGMLVDLAHVSESAFYSALEVTSKPVVFSHGNARALCDHPRNLTDAQLKALAANRGVIGLSYVPMFIDKEKPCLERLLDHVDHIAAVAGIDVIGLGGDFDGGGTLLANAVEVFRITEGLLKRGYAEADVRRILGGNSFRVLKETIG